MRKRKQIKTHLKALKRGRAHEHLLACVRSSNIAYGYDFK
jgi:hypothetical protein